MKKPYETVFIKCVEFPPADTIFTSGEAILDGANFDAGELGLEEVV